MIDKNKQHRTRDGRDVRIYAVDGDEPYTVHGAYKGDAGWVVSQWTCEGCFQSTKFSDRFDLIEVKPRIKRYYWVNVYPEYTTYVGGYSSKGAADNCAEKSRIACVKLTIDCEEGEGL